MKLTVQVKIDAPSVDRAQLDALMDGELSAFEQDLKRVSERGANLQGPLTSMERGTIKAYLHFALTRGA